MQRGERRSASCPREGRRALLQKGADTLAMIGMSAGLALQFALRDRAVARACCRPQRRAPAWSARGRRWPGWRGGRQALRLRAAADRLPPCARRGPIQAEVSADNGSARRASARARAVPTRRGRKPGAAAIRDQADAGEGPAQSSPSAPLPGCRRRARDWRRRRQRHRSPRRRPGSGGRGSSGSAGGNAPAAGRGRPGTRR